MQSYYDEHIHQRKSSLTSYSKTKRQPSKTYEQNKNTEPSLNRQSSNQYLKSQPKSISKPTLNQNVNKTEERNSSIKKNNPRLRDQESSDYIRNLYKKYLGKENKEPVDKLSAFTERKLRTTESKQLIANNTTSKDMTRRTLFAESQSNETPTYNHYKKQAIKAPQIQPSSITLMKKERNKIQSVLSRPSEVTTLYENNYQKSTHLQNSKTIFQTNKKQLPKKQNFESKKSNKNYKSKSKVEKQKTQPDQQIMKPSIIKRSQSTQLKSEKSNTFFQSNKKNPKQKQNQQIIQISNTQLSKTNNMKSNQNMMIHPHRQSYCQFDTEQEIINNFNFSKHHGTFSKHQRVRIDNKDQTVAQSRQSQNTVTNQINQQRKRNQQRNQKMNLNGQVYTRFINDLQTLGMMVGKESSLFMTLQKINKVKNKRQPSQMNRNAIKQQEKYHPIGHKLFI